MAWAALVLAWLCLQAPACAAQASIEASVAKPADSVRIRMQHGEGEIEVRSPGGIGSAQLVRTGAQWPVSLRVRLKEFGEIEHFRATSQAASLICALERPEGVTARHRCHVNAVEVAAPRRIDQDFEIPLPAALLTLDSRHVVLEWVDYWR